jgi:phenylalanyl-tRNA synthetase alpha subunit
MEPIIMAYNDASPTIHAALGWTVKKLIELIEDEELKGSNEYLRNDLISHLGKIQQITSELSDISNTEVEYVRVHRTLSENKDIVSNALSLYRDNAENSKKFVEEKLKGMHMTFPRLDYEIKNIERAVNYLEQVRTPLS